ncbi:hypothetical protein ACFSUK_22235 [Sphingobium scionense]
MRQSGAPPPAYHVRPFRYIGVQADWNRDSIGSANSDIYRLDMHESRDAFSAAELPFMILSLPTGSWSVGSPVSTSPPMTHRASAGR